MSTKNSMKVIATNKKASFLYTLIDEYNAGISLLGSEVKAIRENKINIKESYIYIKHNEVYVKNMHIGEYSHKGYATHKPLRERKLLLKKKEIHKMVGAVKKEGMTIVPLCLYFNTKGFAKITIGLAKGKKKHDKRATIKEKEWNIKKQRMLKKN